MSDKAQLHAEDQLSAAVTGGCRDKSLLNPNPRGSRRGKPFSEDAELAGADIATMERESPAARALAERITDDPSRYDEPPFEADWPSQLSLDEALSRLDDWLARVEAIGELYNPFMEAWLSPFVIERGRALLAGAALILPGSSRVEDLSRRLELEALRDSFARAAFQTREDEIEVEFTLDCEIRAEFGTTQTGFGTLTPAPKRGPGRHKGLRLVR
jgi:hypothetical protein